MKNYSIIWHILFILSSIHHASFAQTTHLIDASHYSRRPHHKDYKMGSNGTPGNEFGVNNLYLTYNGQAITPVMGELHFSRTPIDQWEQLILKMKSGGINIISSYVFWIHHEEVEGQFDWTGNKNLRRFVELCQKHGMWVCLRIGPWVHGEARNGGTPDWILTKKYLKNRSNDPVYQHYVDAHFQQIGQQLTGLMIKDGGPVMCIQLENEYARGKEGESHILWLKQTAIKHGLDVPLYTVTGWGDASIPKDEVIPLWGGYPDQPWTPSMEKLTDCSDYQFKPYRNDEKIGNGLRQKNDSVEAYYDEPFFTCEMGVGVHSTKHRRSVISPIDGYTMILNRIGSGSNLLGYYMFAGGSNPVGLTAMNEDMDETGNWSETPVKSYDFQAAISENGRTTAAYQKSKKINYFLNAFGTQLAPMQAFFTETGNDFQLAARANDSAAFVFGTNYCRHRPHVAQNQVKITIQLKSDTLTFPDQPIDIPDSCQFIWPVNLDLGGHKLCYATAQPLCKPILTDGQIWIFFQNKGVEPQFCLDASHITSISSTCGTIKREQNNFLIQHLKPGPDCRIEWSDTSGKPKTIILLSDQDALDAWWISTNNANHFLLSKQTIVADADGIQSIGSEAIHAVKYLREDGQFHVLRPDSALKNKPASMPESFSINPLKKDILSDAVWLKSSVDKVHESTRLYHKLFLKEFSLGNPSDIKSAILYMAASHSFRIQVNNKWVNQKTETGELCQYDLTGYVQRGDNLLMFDFPFEEGNHAFAAKLMVRYMNSDEFLLATDDSWLMAEQYYYPAPLGTFANFFTSPEKAGPQTVSAVDTGFVEYEISLPCSLNEASNVFLEIDYAGDRAELRFGHRLVADHFYNGKPWVISLKHLGDELRCRHATIRIMAHKPESKVLYDKAIPVEWHGKSQLTGFRVIPEYTRKFSF